MNAIPKILQWLVQQSDSQPLALWNSEEIAVATGGEASTPFQVAGVEIDSRDVMEGDLFFALPGATSDGHAFIDAAFANGAAAAVVDRPISQPHVLVENTSTALEALGKAARDRSEAKVFGVTGSVGKTGVKEALFAALDRSSRGAAHRSVRSYNNHVGVPLSLARMSGRAKFGVFEMGMNHAGEIEHLTRQVRPHVALITTIAPAHIEMLGSEDAIADAKAEIFLGLEEGGVAVIPADNPHFDRLRRAAYEAGATVLGFGTTAHADVRLLDSVPQANGGSLVTADLGDRRLCYNVAEPGDHWVANSLAVIAAVNAVGGDLGAAGLALAEMGGLKGRGARHRIDVSGGQALLIDESYNANPASMRATLAQLGQTPATRRVAVLGAMKELGDFASGFHSALSEPLEAAEIDYVVLVGEEMEALANELGNPARAALGKRIPFAQCDSLQEAIHALSDFGLQGGDAVLVKGSNSVGLAQLVSHFTRSNAGQEEG